MSDPDGQILVIFKQTLDRRLDLAV